MSTLVSFVSGVVGFGMHLGVIRLFWIAALCLVGILVFKMLDKMQKCLDWCGRHWRKAPLWRKQVYGVFGAVVAYKVLWPAVPKTSTAVAFGLCAAVFFYAQGYQYAKKYGLVGTHALAAWRHHWRVTRAVSKHTAALHDSTGKKGGRARRPTITPDGQEFVVQPEHGMSDVETAEAYNDGKMTSALIDRFGHDAVQDVHAETAGDGTIKVSLLAAQTKDDFFAKPRPWAGMEKP